MNHETILSEAAVIMEKQLYNNETMFFKKNAVNLLNFKCGKNW